MPGKGNRIESTAKRPDYKLIPITITPQGFDIGKTDELLSILEQISYFKWVNGVP